MRRAVLISAVVTVAGICVALGARYVVSSLDESSRRAALEQFGEALRLYASHGDFYPPKCLETDMLLPDLNALTQVVPDVRQKSQIMAFYTDQMERPPCYVGHVLANEEMTDILFRRYDEGLTAEVRNSDIPEGESGLCGDIRRIREGVQRCFIWDIGNPAASMESERRLPVLWEIPKNGRDKFFVCFMDGHVERLEYPLPSPDYRPDPMWALSVHSINTIRRALSLPVDPELPVVPSESPVAGPVMAALQVSSCYGTAYECFVFGSCDIAPSIHIEGCAGYYAGLGPFELILFPDAGRAPTLSGAELPFKLYEINRHDQLLRLRLGSGMGFVWYGNMTYGLVRGLQEELDLTGGEDSYPAFVKAWPHKVTLPEPESTYSNLAPAQRILKLKGIMEEPTSVKDYTEAYLLLRAAQGNPVSQEIIDACGMLCFCCLGGKIIGPPGDILDQARARLSSDPEAAAVVAVGLLGRCDERRRPRFLAGFPAAELESLSKHLSGCPDWLLPRT